ncbi:MAG: hypothetical protein F2519_03280 [Actinobacteria bacterium]|nr:hypothetical protein [Actinomycetota bacterium]MTA04588.1 hypothetical protein [Actinomycetota bacterium]MTA22501.1 hypothetical protein [Actinomycetota bacterium]
MYSIGGLPTLHLHGNDTLTETFENPLLFFVTLSRKMNQPFRDKVVSMLT